MMKLIFTILITLSVHVVLANNAVDLRNRFEEACVNESKAGVLFDALASIQTNNQLIHGYCGAVESVMARFSSNPLTKLKYCKNGLSRLNKAITEAPEMLELRYLRMMIEYHLPSFLNMSGHLQTDKKAALTLLHESQDHDLNSRVISFLLEKNMCTQEEKSKLITR